jgi:hypothetical protein
MPASWWQYRQWRFLADMNGDGLVTTSDAPLWVHWLFYLPGDAFIAQFGGTRLGTFLELTPASFGSTTSAVLAVVLWLLAIGVVFYLPRLLVDIVDPTSRQQRREQRAAQRARKHRAPLTRAQPRRFERGELRLEERQEPRFEDVSAQPPAEVAEPRRQRTA